MTAAPPTFHRRVFAWREPTHPLLQRRLPPPAGGHALFRSPTRGALRALVADHVVRGRIVFPGAAYLETARAAFSAGSSASAGVALGDVFFLQPLAVGGEAELEEPVAHCSGRAAAAEAVAWRAVETG